MPSLRVLPVGNSKGCGEVLLRNFTGIEETALEWLSSVCFEEIPAALPRAGADLLLFFLDGANPGERDRLYQRLEAAAGEIASVVFVSTYDAAEAAEVLRRGAQDYLFLEGLSAQRVGRALRHAWERHAARGPLARSSQEMAARLETSMRTVDQLSARMKEEADERIRAEKALVETVSRYRFLLDSLPQIVWTADAKGELVYLNRFWIGYSGHSMEETLAGGWGEFIHPDDLSLTLRRKQESLENGTRFELQHRLRAKDGSYRWHELRAVPRCDPAGRILEWIGTEADIDDQKRVEERLTEAHDELGIRILERTSELAHANELLQAEVAERRRAEAEALHAREIAEAANRSKTEFLANISHEIRTPMNGIIGMTELALETNLDLQQREYLQLVAHSADSLLILINDMLDFAKIEAGRLELENEPFSLRKTLEESVKAMAMRASQKGINLGLEVAPDVPSNVVGDCVRLRQVMINLLGNAIKFTEKGKIGVRVSPISTRNDHVNLLFEVSDTGIGIPEDKQTVIFEAFAQVDGSMTRRYGGTGLGLAIVSSLVKKMGGDIRVSSKLGEGSTFAFNLPVRVADFQEEPASSAPVLAETEPKKAAPMHVMIVAEERSETGMMLAEMFRSMGQESTLVGLGEAALGELERAHMQGRSYRLVMVDTALGDMSGQQFVQSLAKNRVLNAPVVLMLSGAATSEEVKNAWAAGPDWVLYKPVMPADLRETLERSLMMVEPDSVAAAGFAFSAVAPEPKPSLRVLIAEDNLVNQIVAERILSSFGCTLVTVANGREAVAAVEREPFDLILMDIQMPEMDGMEATRRIRSFPDERAHLPIVAMTAHAMKGDRERFLAAGMDHYISKPFHKDELLLLIKSIEPRVRQSAAQPKAAALAPKGGVSLKGFLSAMEGDEALFRGACDLFAEWIPGLVTELGGALEAHQAADAERLAHNLKDSLDSVGARETSERITVLEANIRSRDFPGALVLFAGIESEIREILAEIEAVRTSAAEAPLS